MHVMPPPPSKGMTCHQLAYDLQYDLATGNGDLITLRTKFACDL